MDKNELTAIFADVGGRYGYKTVTADFAAFRDFRVKWARTYRWAEFHVSDYLDNAPDIVLEALADTIFGKINNQDAPYPDIVCDWLTSSEFLESNQAVYIRRCPGVTTQTRGKHKDLIESYERLIDMGLLEEDPELAIGWTRSSVSSRVGEASVLMKVVTVNSKLDSDEVSDEMLDFCLYAQACHVARGFNPRGCRRNAQYGRILSLFPNRREIEKQIRGMSMRLRGGGVPLALTRPVIVRR
ncbi:MAG: hypothetical protein Q4Q58_04950 [Thermoplasmata archaeon]|nr:hypothetical protein [Thermoplasmata archaeon]